MEERKSVFKEFVQLSTAAFAGAVLIMSIIGRFVGDLVEGTTTMFSLGDAGLSYQTIFQILIFAIVNSGITVILGKILKYRLLLWNLITIMFACLLASAVLAGVFRWIPVDSLASWIWFVSTFVGMFVIVSAILVVRIRLADKKYEKLLADYKAKQTNN